jgi:hypothetical protein
MTKKKQPKREYPKNSFKFKGRDALDFDLYIVQRKFLWVFPLQKWDVYELQSEFWVYRYTIG